MNGAVAEASSFYASFFYWSTLQTILRLVLLLKPVALIFTLFLKTFHILMHPAAKLPVSYGRLPEIFLADQNRIYARFLLPFVRPLLDSLSEVSVHIFFILSTRESTIN